MHPWTHLASCPLFLLLLVCGLLPLSFFHCLQCLCFSSIPCCVVVDLFNLMHGLFLDYFSVSPLCWCIPLNDNTDLLLLFCWITCLILFLLSWLTVCLDVMLHLFSWCIPACFYLNCLLPMLTLFMDLCTHSSIGWFLINCTSPDPATLHTAHLHTLTSGGSFRFAHIFSSFFALKQSTFLDCLQPICI